MQRRLRSGRPGPPCRRSGKPRYCRWKLWRSRLPFRCVLTHPGRAGQLYRNSSSFLTADFHPLYSNINRRTCHGNKRNRRLERCDRAGGGCCRAAQAQDPNYARSLAATCTACTAWTARSATEFRRLSPARTGITCCRRCRIQGRQAAREQPSCTTREGLHGRATGVDRNVFSSLKAGAAAGGRRQPRQLLRRANDIYETEFIKWMAASSGAAAVTGCATNGGGAPDGWS